MELSLCITALLRLGVSFISLMTMIVLLIFYRSSFGTACLFFMPLPMLSSFGEWSFWLMSEDANFLIIDCKLSSWCNRSCDWSCEIALIRVEQKERVCYLSSKICSLAAFTIFYSLRRSFKSCFTLISSTSDKWSFFIRSKSFSCCWTYSRNSWRRWFREFSAFLKDYGSWMWLERRLVSSWWLWRYFASIFKSDS